MNEQATGGRSAGGGLSSPDSGPDILSGDFLARLLESSPDCIKVLDLDACLLFMSAGGLCAMEIDDLRPFLGRHWIEFWTGEDRDAAEKAVEEAKAGRVSRFQGFCPTAKGTPKWWDVTVGPMSCGNGRPGQLLSISRDITALRAAEADLQASLEQNRRRTRLFDTAIGKMRQGLCFFDGEQRLIVANRRYAEIYDLSPAQTSPGTTLREIVEHRFSAGSGPDMTGAEYLRWRDEVAVSPEPSDSKVRLRNGRTIAIHHEPMPDGGWVSTHDDITELTRAEQQLSASERRYRALVEASSSIFWRADANGFVLQIDGWEEFTGQPAETYRRNGWLAVVHPDDLAHVVAQCEASVNTGKPLHMEYRLRHVSGDYRWVVGSGIPVRAADGTIEEWVGTVTDHHEKRQAEDTLRRAEEQIRLAAQATGLGVWDIDLKTGNREWSSEMREMLGVSAEAEIGHEAFLERVHPSDRARFLKHVKRTRFATQASADFEFRIVRADNGDIRWVVTCGRTLVGDDGQPSRRIGTIQDITARKQSEAALRDSEERLMLALRAGRMYAWDRDLTTGFVTRSENAKELIGLGSGPFSEFAARIHPDDRDGARSLARAKWGTDSDQSELRYIRPDGQTVWLAARSIEVSEVGRPKRLVGITLDVTETKAAEQEVWRVAHHDPLTGLPNRRLFQSRFEQALAEAERGGSRVGLLLIDLDDFKDVNDTLGHAAGDALLNETARRLSALVRDRDTVARLGGDEFAVIVASPIAPDHAAALAQSIVERVREPFSYEGAVLASRASVGVAIYPDHDRLPHELMKDADIALYRAKADGRNRVVAYSPALRSRTEQRVFLAREMREALRHDQIVPFYQPKVCFSTGRVVGFEALARWLHPSRGVLTPGFFGPVFEDPELARAIGSQLIRQVASDIRGWLDGGLDIGRVAVNLSSAEFSQPKLAENILGALTTAGVPTHHFEVEVTETVFLGKSSEAAPEVLKRLSANGVTVALDDFGTGFASLTHLKHFPVDHIKIDQSFVRDLEQDRDDAAIVTAVIGLGKSLKLSVTAEGVETVGQAQRLRALGCDYAQGYLYAKPMVGSRVPWFLTNWHRERPEGTSHGERRPRSSAQENRNPALPGVRARRR